MINEKINFAELMLYVLGGISVFFVDIYQYFLAMLIMVVCDTAIKIIAIKKDEGWKAVKSRKMRVGIVTKLIGYVSVIVGFHSVEFFIDSTLPLTKLVTYILAIIELKSISENFEQISGTSIWTYIGAFVNSKLPQVKEENKEEK